MIAFKTPPLPGLIGGVIIATILGLTMQGGTFGGYLDVMHYGYVFEGDPDLIGEALFEDLDYLLSRGGLDDMLWTVSLIICAMAFGGIMDGTGMLATIAETLLKFAKGTGMLIVVTLFTALLTNILTADQYLSLIIPGRMYKRAYEDRRLKSKNLARTIEDGGTMTSALVPWNTCGATMSRFLGVPTWGAGGYGPFAFLNWTSPIVSAFYGFTGISIWKMTDEEYEKAITAREAELKAEMAALEA
jgi:NhaC family Na+:H+ antiporter